MQYVSRGAMQKRLDRTVQVPMKGRLGAALSAADSVGGLPNIGDAWHAPMDT